MDIIKLQIDKIMIHQIFQRDHEGNKITPKRSSDFIRFDKDAMDTFELRFTNAIGSNSKAVPMTIVNQDPTDLASQITKISEANDTTYKDISYDIANKLADAQQRKNLSGGIVVVFSGTFGATPKKICRCYKSRYS
jgi:hypothetical protein